MSIGGQAGTGEDNLGPRITCRSQRDVESLKAKLYLIETSSALWFVGFLAGISVAEDSTSPGKSP